MTRSFVFGLVLAVWSMAIAAPPAVAQTTVIPGSKLPGSGGDITELIQDRNFVTIAADGEITGLHPNEFLINYRAEDVTAANGGQTIFVGGERGDGAETFYRNGDVPTTFILGGPSQGTHLEDCLIFDIDGSALSVRSTDTSPNTKLQPVIVTSYPVSASGIEVEVENGKITATDTNTEFKRVTNVEFSDGMKVDADTINAVLVVHDGTPVPVGPGGARHLRVVDPDDPETFAPSTEVIPGIILIDGRISTDVKGGDKDDVFVVDARLGLPNIVDPTSLDGGGGDDVYVVRSAAENTRDLKITVREGDEDVVMLADFSPEFETLSLGDGRFEFIVNKVDGFVVKQVIHFVDETGAPVSSGGVPPMIIRGAEVPG